MKVLYEAGVYQVRDQGEANTLAITENGQWLAVIKMNGELSVASQIAHASLFANALYEADLIQRIAEGIEGC